MHLRALRSVSSRSCHHRAAQHLASRPLLASSAAPNADGLMQLHHSPISRFRTSPIACGTPLTWQENACRQSADSDWADEPALPVNKVQRIVDDISSLTLVEVSELNLLLKKRFCLQHVETLPMGMGIVPVPGMQFGSFNHHLIKENSHSTEKSSFSVKIEKYDAASKGRVIKQVRALTLLGLKEARELLSKTPALVRGGMSKEEAKRMIEKLQAAGATAFIE